MVRALYTVVPKTEIQLVHLERHTDGRSGEDHAPRTRYVVPRAEHHSSENYPVIAERHVCHSLRAHVG